MERTFPHVRDIFAPYRSSRETSAPPVDKIQVYQHSPGSRRRRHDPSDDPGLTSDFIDTDHSDSTDETPFHHHHHHNNNARNSSNRPRHISNNGRNNSYSDLVLDKGDAKGGYSSKTLTERDIRHLERHLSMKKTIRKQISRNLAQAFVEDTVVFQGDSAVLVPGVNSTSSPEPTPAPFPAPLINDNSNFSFTLTRAKMAARAEHTFLDMLKKEGDGSRASEADSGHSSPSHQGGFDDEPTLSMDLDYPNPQRPQTGYTTFKLQQSPSAGGEVPLQQQTTAVAQDQHKKHSFWKKFGFKGKGKR